MTAKPIRDFARTSVAAPLTIAVIATLSLTAPLATSVAAGATHRGTSRASESTSAFAIRQAREVDASASASLSGAGSTFDAPFFTRAFYTYNLQHPNVTISYAAIGSGGGIQQFQLRTVDFGASDVPMTRSQLSTTTGTVLQVPIALGGEAIAYNLPGVKSGLKVTGTVLAEIYLSKIKYWDDKELRTLNPRVALPHEAITVVHRSDGSGSTYVFTDYLSMISTVWKRHVGHAISISWPAGIGGKGNGGVAGLVHDVPGAIGYVELAYALENGLTYCEIENAAGKFVAPSLSSIGADAAQKPDVSAMNFSIVNEKGSTSYPIAAYSWMLVYKRQSSAGTGRALAELIDWMSTTAQQEASSLNYAPLPARIRKLASGLIAQLTDPYGKRLL